MKACLITGSNGFIGSYLTEYLADSFCPRDSFHVLPTDIPSSESVQRDFIPMDVTDAEAVRQVMAVHRPDVVLHLAAIKNVGYCERNEEEARRVNVLGTKNVVEGCAEVAAFLVFLSSDYVFEGGKGMYAEHDARNPLTVYGQTKKEAEDLIIHSGIKAAICRSSGVYGPSRRQDMLIGWAENKLRQGEIINAYSNIYNSPTCIYDLCRGLGLVMRQELTGIFHLAGSQRVSRYEFLKTYALVRGFDPDLIIEDRYVPSPGGFRRPFDVSFMVAHSEAKLGMNFLRVRQGLELIERKRYRV